MLDTTTLSILMFKSATKILPKFLKSPNKLPYNTTLTPMLLLLMKDGLKTTSSKLADSAPTAVVTTLTTKVKELRRTIGDIG